MEDKVIKSFDEAIENIQLQKAAVVEQQRVATEELEKEISKLTPDLRGFALKLRLAVMTDQAYTAVCFKEEDVKAMKKAHNRAKNEVK